ncbi:MAG TPA: ABC transporter substrate-binding protein [Bacillota bacterium]|jgi:branched-chain amino acid transport system substrate-binding protein|nr:ABC transporter substrate-binding protein [Fastidiosipila sp.]HPX93768.1 ABC transporter substrate-binding protein [Bacillota bacterium]HQB81593.1 ABC transporter substrate-binding protein [Bacillota bacterium]
MKRYLAALLSVLLLLCLMAGCAGTTPNEPSNPQPTDKEDLPGPTGNEEVIKFGVFEPMTGANAAWGEYELRGIELANELYPEVLGKRIELVIADNKSDVVEAANAAARLAENSEVTIVLGSAGSSLAMAGGDIFLSNQVPAIGTSPTSPNVTLGNDYYFRVCFIDTFQGIALANYAASELGLKKGAIIYEITNDTCVAMRAPLTKAYNNLGGEILTEATFSVGDQDFNAQLIAVMAKNPEVIFCPGNPTEVALLIKQARALGYEDVMFMSSDAVDVPVFLEVGGDDLEGVYVTTHFSAEAPINDMTTVFTEAYSAKYDDEPGALTALAFDSYVAAVEAIKAANSTDGPALQKALANLSFEGCTGRIEFDENGDAIKNQVVLKIVENNQWKYGGTTLIEKN